MNPFAKHAVIAVLVAMLLGGATWAVFSHLEAEKEITVLCEFLNGVTPGQAEATFATLVYSQTMDDGDDIVLSASWANGFIQGSRCRLSPAEGSDEARWNARLD